MRTTNDTTWARQLCPTDQRPLYRYLHYETATPVVAGLNHQVSNLRCLLIEAHATGRLALLPSLHLDPKHNFGVRRDWKWESYFDMSKSRLVDAATGREHPLPIAEHLPEAGIRTLVLSPGERVPELARDYPLLVRRIELQVFRREVPVDWPATKLRLCPSPLVLDLARSVVQHIGLLDHGRFVAVHVRRGDRLKEYPGWLTEPAYIRKYLMERRIADGSVVFIASDEHDPNFWKPLQAHYRLIRFVDFSRLKALVSADGSYPPPPDNYLLYQVEQEVMRSAWRRIETLPIVFAHGYLVREEDWSRPFAGRNTWVRRAAERFRNKGRAVATACGLLYRRRPPPA